MPSKKKMKPKKKASEGALEEQVRRLEKENRVLRDRKAELEAALIRLQTENRGLLDYVESAGGLF